ncbi:hypothetical protein, partial [Escherichia coli]|uniref:hypothetical protein n=1 Tax=Escherichia coli TaxID=562 RepID=UPI001A928D04
MAIGLGAYGAHETHFRTFSVRESLTHCYISEQTPLAAPAKWHLNRSQFGIRIDHDLASISDH